MTKKWLSAPPKVTLTTTLKSDFFDPKSDSKVTFRSRKSLSGLLLGLLWGGPRKLFFLVTFELLLIFQIFGGSRNLGGQQLHNSCPSGRMVEWARASVKTIAR